METVIRRARPRDKRGVLRAVRTIWGGEDRVPGLFDRWVTHRTGPFFVAETNGRVVGMGKLTVVSPTEAWLEGGRVAPRWRHRGIATALIAHRLWYARERGFRVVRFSTASNNTPIHRASRRFGFRRVREFERFEAPADRSASPARRARESDAARLRRLVGPYVQAGHGWRWVTLTDDHVRRAIASGRAFLTQRRDAAGLVARVHGGVLPVVASGGSGRAFAELLGALRGEAARRGASEVGLYLADAVHRRAARTAGYLPPWSGAAWLFEKRL